MNREIKYRQISKILIANRGEIASRIIRTARKMGISTVGIITEAEPTTETDESIFIKGDSLAETYLNIEAIINAAKKTNADAIHPGYGFLSENHNFAKAVEDSNIIFIGPKSQAIESMGDKTNAREIASELNIPIPHGASGTIEQIIKQKDEFIYPLLIKAAAGGGGKGMSIVLNKNELQEKLEQTQREAKRYFGDDSILVEQLIQKPRHIEVQVLCDMYGNNIHLYERECSIQRRYQKIIEEAPALNISENLRNSLTNDALKLCETIGYENAGTVEFLVDENDKHFFLEMNTRLQVEHPVTEMITGVDIVEQQILIAMGLPLNFSQSDIKINGHAIESRIYAENPEDNFQPSPGFIQKVKWPIENIARVDKWFDKEIEILPTFDPMLAKIITHGASRDIAISKMDKALKETQIIGIKQNIEYLISILNDNKFKKNIIDTNYCNIHQADLKNNISNKEAIIAATIWHLLYKTDNINSWQKIGHFRVNRQITLSEEFTNYRVNYSFDKERIILTIEDDIFKVKDYLITEDKIIFKVENREFSFGWVLNYEGKIILQNGSKEWEIKKGFVNKTKKGNNSLIDNDNTIIKAPIPGRIVKINVEEGESVSTNSTLLVLEAMKMENHISMPSDGIIKKISVENGSQVKANEILIEIENSYN